MSLPKFLAFLAFLLAVAVFALFAGMAGMGLFGMTVPAEFGGLGRGRHGSGNACDRQLS